MGKRIFDFCAALIGVVLLSPFLAGIAMVVWLSSGRPVFFVQERVGRGGRAFRLYKFRTMRIMEGAEKGRFDPGVGGRITPVGRVLRRSKLDELPQLLNVLKGDLSLVGPRPEIRRWVDEFPEEWEEVLTVRPGITDPASIEFRSEEEILSGASDPEGMYRDEILPKKLALYREYIRNRSLGHDIFLICKTLGVVIRGTGKREKT